MAATNRWLTAADAYVARYPTKLAFCSRFRRQRETPVNVAERRFSLASGSRVFAETAWLKRIPHKAQKGRRWKTASLRTAR
ncbi:hypothetical protein E2553_14190 [Paraburkholderia dipogonis]|uniref:Uncharacterized protein n=1 Tax=Paraburkholderia dipogonis TaxID=1211383 RepID=A0A4Y8N9P5_9BURK|nr:hypothetical protein [Paraburkholderia dipogonis]TFE46068.1 hypothetical protein E2553_14190 [Paraburkholderia dipogonis]